MAEHAKSELVVSNWDEGPLTQIEGGAAVTRATSDAVFTGDLQGTGTSAWVLVYPVDAAPVFVGTQTFEGVLADRAGTFVLQMEGTFHDVTIDVSWSVVPGSGTGQLEDLRGRGGYASAPDASSATATLDWELG
jgi:hypothetical protein